MDSKAKVKMEEEFIDTKYSVVLSDKSIDSSDELLNYIIEYKLRNHKELMKIPNYYNPLLKAQISNKLTAIHCVIELILVQWDGSFNNLDIIIQNTEKKLNNFVFKKNEVTKRYQEKIKNVTFYDFQFEQAKMLVKIKNLARTVKNKCKNQTSL